MQLGATEKQHKMASSEKDLLVSLVHQSGEEPMEEYHAGYVSSAVRKTSIAMPVASRKGGVVN